MIGNLGDEDNTKSLVGVASNCVYSLVNNCLGLTVQNNRQPCTVHQGTAGSFFIAKCLVVSN